MATKINPLLPIFGMIVIVCFVVSSSIKGIDGRVQCLTNPKELTDIEYIESKNGIEFYNIITTSKLGKDTIVHAKNKYKLKNILEGMRVTVSGFPNGNLYIKKVHNY